MVKISIRILALVLYVVYLCDNIHAGNNQRSIVNNITSANNNTVNQPEQLAKRLYYCEESVQESEQSIQKPQSANHVAGYRIQVFSDNNSRTAKNEARTKARNISSIFPQFRTYVTYNSPYWRLKIGDFRTQQEANAVAEELRQAFPSYSKEIRIVRDRINLTE